MDWQYCPWCGEDWDNDAHSCEATTNGDPNDSDEGGWCPYCGAELNSFGECGNDHNEEDDTE